MKYGLGENQLREILDILRKYPEVEEAILFGSRAIGTYKEASDIDIALKGKDVSVILATKIESDLEDTYLPYFFDIISFPSVTNQDLIKHINTKGIPIYRTGWKKCKLGDVVNIIGGGTPKTTIDRYWGGDIPWVSIADIVQSNKYIHSTSKTITKEGLKNSSTRLLDERDIIISARGTIGAVAVLKSRMAFNQSCYGISAKKDFLDQEYLYYLLTNLITSFNQYSHGGVFDTITRKTFDSIEIYLPPLHKQKEIASILSCLDDKIDLLHRQNKTLESIAQTLFHQWFIKEADENWEFEILSKSCMIVDCLHSKKPEQVDLENSSNYLLQVYNIGEDGNIDLSNKFCVSERDYKEWTKRIEVKHGDIVISKTGRVGAMMQIPHYITAGIGRNLVVIRPRKSVTKEFLKDLMFSSWMRDQIERNTSDGTILRSLHVKNIEQLKTPICKSEKINDYSDFIFPIHRKQENNLIQISTLKKKRNILLKVLLENKLGE